jgi:hypothetical protein
MMIAGLGGRERRFSLCSNLAPELRKIELPLEPRFLAAHSHTISSLYIQRGELAARGL